jgi:uncharacterized protein (TIGR00369 family)
MTTAPKTLAEMTGLEQLQAALEAGGDKRGIGKTLGFQLITLEEGKVVFGGTPDEDVFNPIGTVHGGYAATLLDSALACAVHSALKAGQAYTTLELKVSYHKAMTATTGPVTATGTVKTMGRRAAFAEGQLTDAEGRLYASATSTLLVFDR